MKISQENANKLLGLVLNDLTDMSMFCDGAINMSMHNIDLQDEAIYKRYIRTKDEVLKSIGLVLRKDGEKGELQCTTKP